MLREIIEPATEKVLAEIEDDSPQSMSCVVERAVAAQRVWAGMAPASRAHILLKIADGLRENQEAIAQLESRNVGMPIADARGCVAGAAETFRYFSGAPERLLGETIPVEGGVDFTFREPIGVVGLITPWNFPLTIASWKIASALAAGNSVVIKPSELTPLSAIELHKIALNAGLPGHVLTLVQGEGNTIGKAIVDHPGIGKISFTGSSAVGRQIAVQCANLGKRVTLELGGKSPSVIFADSDIEAAARGLAGGVFGNAGQDCCARSRVFIQRSAKKDFLDILDDVVNGMVVGDPLSEDTTMGPLISGTHRKRVSAFVSPGEILLQGNAPTGPGYWFPPTVLRPESDHSPASREEIFGPVVSVFDFETEDEAVERANDSEYGLAASVWSSDGARALRVMLKLKAGAGAINSYSTVRTTTPFGGFKNSGLGRELGPNGLDAYTEIKNVFIDTRK